MREGRSGIGRIVGDSFGRYKDSWTVRIAGQVRGFDPTKVIEFREAKRLDRFTQLGVCAVDEAVRESGIDFAREDHELCGIAIGSGIGGIQTIEEGLLVMQER